MTAGTTVAATDPDRLHAAVNAAAGRLYDAEAALHIAQQTGVYAWIGAAYARLQEAIADHIAAVDAYESIAQTHRASYPPAAA